jgi:hypothetical protein
MLAHLAALGHFPETPFTNLNLTPLRTSPRKQIAVCYDGPAMRALEVHLNGKRLCTAGIGDAGVLTAIVRSDLRPPQVSAKKSSLRANEHIGLDVGGLNTSTWEHIRWKTPRLRGGDEILIRIIEANVVDKPSSRERADPAEVINAEKKHVEMLAKKLGWKIVKPQRDGTPNP